MQKHHLLSEEQIIDKYWREAQLLVNDIDENDLHYIAYSKQFKCKIWTGDKKLAKGLFKKGFLNLLNTDDLYTLRQKRIK